MWKESRERETKRRSFADSGDDHDEDDDCVMRIKCCNTSRFCLQLFFLRLLLKNHSLHGFLLFTRTCPYICQVKREGKEETREHFTGKDEKMRMMTTIVMVVVFCDIIIIIALVPAEKGKVRGDEKQPPPPPSSKPLCKRIQVKANREEHPANAASSLTNNIVPYGLKVVSLYAKGNLEWHPYVTLNCLFSILLSTLNGLLFFLLER